ncbi:MAG: ATP-binding protein [Rhodosalinus sp.]
MNSIRLRLFLILMAATGAVWLSAVLWIQHSTRAEVERVLDARLAEAARMVSSLIEDRRIDVARVADAVADGPEGLRTAASDYSHQLSCQIWSLDGVLAGRSSGAPDARLTGAGEGEGFSTTTVDGERWRVFAMSNPELGVQVMVGDRMQVRERLVADVTTGLVLPALLIFPALAGLIWLSVGRGLKPLNQMAIALAARPASDLSPLPEAPLVREIRPVGAALNGLFRRVEAARERERSFTLFAAHELKTPLAGLRAQAQVAAMAPDEATRARALDRIGQSVQSTDRVVRQLLDLARVDAEVPTGNGPTQSATDLARDVMDDLQPAAARRRVEIVADLEAPEAPRFGSDAFLFVVALRNLVENAILASPEEGKVEIFLTRSGGEWQCTVADRGPGIAEQDRARVTERFYRGRQPSPGGSGLGLAIVAAAMERLGGVLCLEPREGGGETATLVFPEARRNRQ